MTDDEPVTAAWRAGEAAWPGVALDRERFAAHVAALGGLADPRYGADVFLAAACLAQLPAALAVFDRDVLTAAHGTIRAIDGNPAFVDEAVQRLRTNLLVGDGGAPRLAQYAGRGPLRGWIGVAAARVALMMLRAQKRLREQPGDEMWSGALASVTTGNPELDLLKRQYAQAFETALRDAVAALEPRLRTVLRMSFVDGVSIDEIGAVYAVHRATAARWIQRACDTAFAETQRLLAERLSLTMTELDRMNELVRSQLDVSLSQLLPDGVADD